MAEEKAHALLSASGATRWLNCNPSARLEEIFEDTESEFAKEGTLAHELAELKLQKYFFMTGMAKKDYSIKLNEIKRNELWKDEMDNYTDEYVDHVKAITMSFETAPFIEIEKEVDFGEYAPEAFGTADTIIINNDRLYVIDLKYGKGVPVYAENNPQLMLYGLGAYLEYSLFYNIQDIELHIVQPRLDSITVFNISVTNLLDWAENVVRPNAVKAFDGVGEFNPGLACSFCRAGAVCRARAEKNLEIEKEMEKGPILSNSEIGEILKRAKEIAKWAKDLEEYALKACLKGEEIAGWKVVEGRTSRAFSDTDLAIDKLLEHGIAEELIYERKMLTLPQLETLVGKKDFKEYVGDMVVINSGKPTLALETDKREALKPKASAKDDFAVYEEN